MVDPPVSNQTPIHRSPPPLPRCRRPAPGPPAPAWANPPHVYLAGRGRGVRREAADPPSSLSPGGKPRQHPKAGRRPVALRAETHGTKQMEGNKWRETHGGNRGPVSGGLLVLPPQAVPARTLHERGLAGRFLTGAPVGIPSRAADICSAQAPGFRRPPKVPLPWGSDTLDLWRSAWRALLRSREGRRRPCLCVSWPCAR